MKNALIAFSAITALCLVDMSTYVIAACSDPAGPGVEWFGCDKSGLDLSGINWNGATVLNCDFSNSDLSNTNFAGATFYANKHINANLSNASFIGNNNWENWYGGDFTGANLSGAIFSSNVSNDKQLRISSTIFTNANLTNADLSGAYILQSNFIGADLTGASLAGVRIWGSGNKYERSSYITASEFNKAQNRQVKDVRDIDLSNFDLSQVISPFFQGVNLNNANFTGSDLSMAEFNYVEGLSSNQLRSASKLDAIKFVGTDLKFFDLSNIDFMGRPDNFDSFNECDLRGVNFSNSRFGIKSNIIAPIDLTGTNLTNSYIAGSIAGANFSNTNLSGTTFTLFGFTGDGNAYSAASYFNKINFNNATGVPVGIGAGLYTETTCPDGTILNGYGACWDGVKIIVADNSNPGRMYAVHENKKGIYFRTSSIGAWTICPSTGLYDDKLLTLIADNSGKLYAGTKGGIYVSLDGCTSWSSMSDGLKSK